MSILLFLFGACMRLGLLFGERSLWSDELASVEHSAVSLQDAVVYNILDKHAPLYYSLLHFVIKLFGTSEFFLRLPSVTAGLAAAAGTYFLAKALFGKKTALWALFVISVSAYATHMSIEIRNHGFTAAWTAWGSFFLVKLLQEPEKKRWGYGWVACAFLAVASGHLAWFWIIIGVGVQIVMVLRKKLASETLGYTLIFLLFSLPILAIIRLQIPNESITCRMFTEPSLDRLRLIIRGCEDMVWYQTTGPVFLLSEFPLRTILIFARKCWVLAVFLAVAGFVVFMTARRIAVDTFSRKDPRAFVLFLVPAFPIFVTAFLDFERFHYRYFAFTEIASAVLVAHSLAELRWSWARRTIAAGIAFLGIMGWLFMVAYPVDPFERDNYEGLARFVSQYGEKDDATVIFASYTGFHLKKMGLSTQAKMFEENERLRTICARRIGYGCCRASTLRANISTTCESQWKKLAIIPAET